MSPASSACPSTSARGSSSRHRSCTCRRSSRSSGSNSGRRACRGSGGREADTPADQTATKGRLAMATTPQEELLARFSKEVDLPAYLGQRGFEVVPDAKNAAYIAMAHKASGQILLVAKEA